MAQVALPRDRLIEGMEKTIKADLNHKCVGRTALARLKRAAELADQAGLKMPKIREMPQFLHSEHYYGKRYELSLAGAAFRQI